MIAPKLKLYFGGFNDSAFENKSQAIYAAMNENPYFLKPTPALEDLQSAITQFGELNTSSASGDRYQIAEKNRSRKELETLLRRLGGYVIMTGGDDRAILVSSGFDLEKEREATVVLAPQSMKLVSGQNSGEVNIRISGAKGVQTYQYEYTADPMTDNSLWQSETNSKAVHIFKDLVPAKRYWFRVATIGRGSGVKVYNSEVSFIIQ
jgi:hypothetical protein